MKTVTLVINTERGLHATPAAMLAQTCMMFTSSIKIVAPLPTGNFLSIDGKNLVGVYALQAVKGTPLEFKISGDDEQEALDALVDLIEVRNFDGE